jgi:hypothetical protein
MNGPLVWRAAMIVVIFGLGGGIPLFYLFNKQTRQSLHDFLCGTYVVRAGTSHGAISKSLRHQRRMVFASYLPLVCIAALVLQLFGKSGTSLREESTRRAITGIEGVYRAYLSEGHLPPRAFDTGEPAKSYVHAEVFWPGYPHDGKAISNLVGQAILDHFPEITTKDTIIVDAFAGYDIGIAHSYRRFNSVDSPTGWRAHLAGEPTGGQRDAR